MRGLVPTATVALVIAGVLLRAQSAAPVPTPFKLGMF